MLVQSLKPQLCFTTFQYLLYARTPRGLPRSFSSLELSKVMRRNLMEVIKSPLCLSILSWHNTHIYVSIHFWNVISVSTSQQKYYSFIGLYFLKRWACSSGGNSCECELKWASFLLKIIALHFSLSSE